MSSDIKKTLLITLDFPPNFGGVAAYYYHFCRNLPPDKIVVLAPEQIGAKNFDRLNRFPVIRKKILKQFPQTWPKGMAGVLKLAATIKWLSLIKSINQIIKSHQVEQIIAGQVLPIGTLALLNFRRRKMPYLIFAHGLDILLPQKYLRKKTLLKKILNQAKTVVANSHFTKDEVIKLGVSSEKIIVVNPCPAIMPEMAAEPRMNQLRKELDLNNKKILLTVGRLVERKGHDFVIKSLPKIIKAAPNVFYLIVGDGPERQRLQTLVNELSLADYVKFVGRASENDLACFYSLCDIFIMPARELANGDVEGFGIVYLEANLFGKPVIGGRSGGVGEAIIGGKTGLLGNPLNQVEITKAAIHLFTDDAYAQRLGLQGLERVSNEFDWPSQVEKIKEVLK